MKLTAKKLKQIITEELKQTIGESFGDLGPDDETEEKYLGSIDWQRDQEDAERQAASQYGQPEHEVQLEAALNAFMLAKDDLNSGERKRQILKFVEEYLFEEWQREKK